MRFWPWTNRRRRERDLNEEIESHLRMAAEEHAGLGESAEQARTEATREFGNVELVKETTRDMWGYRWLETLMQDVRYGLRQLRRSPGFTVVAVLTLALGIGANTAVFSAINSTLLKPFAAKDLGHMVRIFETEPQQGLDYLDVAPGNFRDWKEQSKEIELLSAMDGWNANLTNGSSSERIEGFRVTANFFPLFGIAPELGQTISAADFKAGQSSVVVLSHGFWKRRFAADAGIVGKLVSVNGQKFSVMGVMPDEFDYPVGADVWAPLDLSAAEQANRVKHDLYVIGQLRSGVSLSQARAEFRAITARLDREYPATNAGHEAMIIGITQDGPSVGRELGLVLMGAAVFVLLLACANVANLLLARATEREKEIALRTALGAGRWRIVRQLLVESVMVSLLGGLAGAWLAGWGTALTRQAIPAVIMHRVAGARHFEVDSTVLVFTLVVALLSGILAGLAPALYVSSPDLNDVLKEGARGGTTTPGRRRLRATLVVAEVAMAFVLLVAAGLMVKGFGRLISEDPGVDRNHVLTFRIALAGSQYDGKNRVRDYYNRLIQKLQTLPGIESAAAATSLPSSGGWTFTDYAVDGQAPAAAGQERLAVIQRISPDFFRALRVPLLKGRNFTDGDSSGAPPVAIISETLARRNWGGQDPVGKRIRPGKAESKEPWRTVVGVVAVFKQFPIDENPEPTLYLPFNQSPQAATAFVVRTASDPAAMAPSLRTAVRSLDPNQPPYDIKTLKQMFRDNTFGLDWCGRMMLVFGMIALLLATAGIFAVMAYSVARRTHEIGVRMALGAQRVDVVRLVVVYAVKLAAIGLVLGGVGALALTRALGSVLFGIFRMDALTFFGFTALLLLVATLAAYVPARRAAKVDPMVALRYE